MINAGVKKQRSVFMVTDYNINASATKDDIFLEDISNLLNQGEIANLWAREDQDEIIRSIKYEASEVGVYENIVETFFLNRMRNNLHLIICMSPIGESFRNRLRMFPSLINCCQINWFQDWPPEALTSVSLKFLQQIPSLPNEDIMIKLANSSVKLNKFVLNEAESFY